MKNELVTKGAADIKFNLSRADILELCVGEARAKLDQAYDIQVGRCAELKIKAKVAFAAVEKEVTALLRKRYAKMIRLLSEDGEEPKVQVSFDYEVDPYQIDTNYRTSVTDAYPPSHRFKYNKSWLRAVFMRIGDVVPDNANNLRRSHCAFEVGVLARDLGDVATVKQLNEAAKLLHEACERLDQLDRDIKTFNRRTKSSKLFVMKRILAGSEKGREILALAKSLSVELDHAGRPLLPATTITVE